MLAAVGNGSRPRSPNRGGPQAQLATRMASGLSTRSVASPAASSRRIDSGRGSAKRFVSEHVQNDECLATDRDLVSRAGRSGAVAMEEG